MTSMHGETEGQVRPPRLADTIRWGEPFDIESGEDEGYVSGPADRLGQATATGHVVGETYLSAAHHQPYTVEAVTTLWMLAPNRAVRVRWANGNVTVSEMARGNDPIFRESRLSVEAA